MKLFRFFISLCLLLLIGHTSVYVFIEGADLAGQMTSVNKKVFYKGNLDMLQSAPSAVLKSASSLRDKNRTRINIPDEDEDDEDAGPIAKYFRAEHQIASVLYPPAFVHFSRQAKRHSSFCKHFSYSSSSRYILFRNIRV